MTELAERFEEERVPLLAESTQKGYGESLRLLRAFLEDRGQDPIAKDFRSGHVRDYLNYVQVNPLRGEGSVSNATVRRHRATISALFSFAEELELVDFNPVAKTSPPKVDGRDPVILTDDQFDALLTACDHNPMLRMYVLVLGETGARCESEALWLRWEDVDLEEGFVRIVSGRHSHRTKSGKGRWVPMTAQLRSAMRDHFADFRLRTYGEPAKRTP